VEAQGPTDSAGGVQLAPPAALSGTGAVIESILNVAVPVALPFVFPVGSADPDWLDDEVQRRVALDGAPITDCGGIDTFRRLLLFCCDRMGGQAEKGL